MKRLYLGAMMLLLLVVAGGGMLGKVYLAEQSSQLAASLAAAQGYEVDVDEEYLDYYGLGAFETTLPVVYIDTDGEDIVKENKIWAEMSILNSVDGEAQSVLTLPDKTIDMTINLRGASSYYQFDKEQYRIKFYANTGSFGALDYEFLGMGADSEWVLNGPFLDRTLIRNSVAYEMSAEILEWAPDTQFCEVFVNGEYKGVYLAVEPITEDIERLDLEKFGLLSGQ